MISMLVAMTSAFLVLVGLFLLIYNFNPKLQAKLQLYDLDKDKAFYKAVAFSVLCLIFGVFGFFIAIKLPLDAYIHNHLSYFYNELNDM